MTADAPAGPTATEVGPDVRAVGVADRGRKRAGGRAANRAPNRAGSGPGGRRDRGRAGQAAGARMEGPGEKLLGACGTMEYVLHPPGDFPGTPAGVADGPG